MIGRRSLLKALGFSPLAARAAAEKTATDLAFRKWPMPALAQGSDMVGAEAPGGGSERAADARRMTDYLRMFGTLPEHVHRETWEQAKYVQSLDADLAVKQSWSLAAKIHEQRQRNYAKAVEGMKGLSMVDEANEAFMRKFGFRWRRW